MNPPYRARDRPLPADTPWLNNTLTLRKEMLLMKKFTKVIALILSLTLLLCFPIGGIGAGIFRLSCGNADGEAE